jgi:TM2 domain-containing membrane protein YozV
MRGRLLAFDFRTGVGEISGLDGQRYRFADSQWLTPGRPKLGQLLDFETRGERALAIHALAVPAGPAAKASGKSRIAAALLALFLGGFGLHKFYLGKKKAGLTMLFCFLFGPILLLIPTAIVAAIALAEAIIYLFTLDEDFEARYVRGDRAWF